MGGGAYNYACDEHSSIVGGAYNSIAADYDDGVTDYVLDKVAALPIDRWSYKSERGVKHVGPMAQDFDAAFGVGPDDKHITSVDEDGVAIAAIKALHAENASLRRQTSELRAEAAALRALVLKHRNR